MLRYFPSGFGRCVYVCESVNCTRLNHRDPTRSHDDVVKCVTTVHPGKVHGGRFNIEHLNRGTYCTWSSAFYCSLFDILMVFSLSSRSSHIRHLIGFTFAGFWWVWGGMCLILNDYFLRHLVSWFFLLKFWSHFIWSVYVRTFKWIVWYSALIIFFNSSTMLKRM